MFLNQSKKKVVHGVHDYTSHDIEVRKSQELRPAYAILFELTGSCFLIGCGFVFSSLTSTFNICPSLPPVVVRAILVTGFCTVANLTKMFMTMSSKASSLPGGWK